MSRSQGQNEVEQQKHDNDNHSNQLNPNHEEYWHSRGEEGPSDDSEQRSSQEEQVKR